MKILILFLFLWGSQAFAAEDLNFQLTQSTAKDDLQEAIRLLDLGADPLKHSYWNGWQVDAAMHVAAREVMKTGKDQVYREFLRRGIPANGLNKVNSQSVWDYIFTWIEDEDTPEKLETFFLRSLAEGANPFPKGPDSGNLSNLILRGQDRVVSEIVSKGVTKISWLLFTGSWANRCENASSYPDLLKSCLESFKKYFPVLQAQGIQAKDWGNYDYISANKPLELKWPAVFKFVKSPRGQMQTELLEEFIRQGYDMNFRFNSYTACEVAEVHSISDVHTLMRFGCQRTNEWMAKALEQKQFTLAQELLSMGHGIDEMFTTESDTHTLLTYFCSSSSNVYPILEWLFKNGANPNTVTAKGLSCLHKISGGFSYYMKDQSDLKALKLFISYKADLNLIVRDRTALDVMADMISMGAGPTDEQKDYIITMGMETLLKAGANPNVVSSGTHSSFAHPFHSLAYYGISSLSLKAINLLLKYKADPRVLSDKHASIIHLISFHCNFQGCVQTLEKALKLAPDLLNQRGLYYNKLNTPLCLAAEKDNSMSAEILLKYKADHKVICEPSGKAPYQTATVGSKVRQVFEKFGIRE